jgi:hypothetical protein
MRLQSGNLAKNVELGSSLTIERLGHGAARHPCICLEYGYSIACRSAPSELGLAAKSVSLYITAERILSP